MSLYEHYKIDNEMKDVLAKDQETEAMKIFVEKMKKWYITYLLLMNACIGMMTQWT